MNVTAALRVGGVAAAYRKGVRPCRLCEMSKFATESERTNDIWRGLAVLLEPRVDCGLPTA